MYIFFFLSKFKFQRLIWFNPTSVAPISLKTHHVKFFPLRSSSIFNNQASKKTFTASTPPRLFSFLSRLQFLPRCYATDSLTIARPLYASSRVESREQNARTTRFIIVVIVDDPLRDKGRWKMSFAIEKSFLSDLDIVLPDDRFINEMVECFFFQRRNSNFFFPRCWFFTDEKY